MNVAYGYILIKIQGNNNHIHDFVTYRKRYTEDFNYIYNVLLLKLSCEYLVSNIMFDILSLRNFIILKYINSNF